MRPLTGFLEDLASREEIEIVFVLVSVHGSGLFGFHPQSSTKHGTVRKVDWRSRVICPLTHLPHVRLEKMDEYDGQTQQARIVGRFSSAHQRVICPSLSNILIARSKSFPAVNRIRVLRSKLRRSGVTESRRMEKNRFVEHPMIKEHIHQRVDLQRHSEDRPTRPKISTSIPALCPSTTRQSG